MGFFPLDEKQTSAPRPTIAANKKLTSSEFNAIRGEWNINYQEFLDLALLVAGLSPTPFIQKDVDFNITSSGIYLFYGSTPRTFTIDDAIDGLVEIRTIADAELTLSGTIYSGHLGIIYPGTAATQFRWDSISGQYTY